MLWFQKFKSMHESLYEINLKKRSNNQNFIIELNFKGNIK